MRQSEIAAISPNKLLNSKWTAVLPRRRQKHFIVVEVDRDDEGRVLECVIEAVIDKQQFAIDWRDLNNRKNWLPGWLK